MVVEEPPPLFYMKYPSLPALLVMLCPAILIAADSPSPTPPASHPPGLRFVEGPPGAVDAVKEYALAPLSSGLNVVDPDHMEISPALPQYDLSELDLAQQKDLTAARHNQHFYYLVKSNGEVARNIGVWSIKGVASVQSEGSNTYYVQVGAALDKLAKLEELKTDSYEVRLLNGGYASDVSFGAIWLKADKPDGDLIYVVSGYRNSPYETGKFYHPKELFVLARPIARAMLNLPTAPVLWSTDDQMHGYFLKRFLQAQGMGFTRMAAPSLSPDDLMQLTISGSAANDGQKASPGQPYQVKSIELVGLAFHDPPVVFKQELYHRPDMRPMQTFKRLPDTYRALTEVEQKMLAALVAGKEDTVAQTDKEQRLVFGAIRTQQSCLDCHTTAKAGDILGAFSYRLIPRTESIVTAQPAAPAK